MLNVPMTLIDQYASSDRGLVREENEDSLLLVVPEDTAVVGDKGILAVVADGVGGGVGGKIASSTAVARVGESYFASESGFMPALVESMREADREIVAKAQGDPSCRGMATTCTAFVVHGYDGYLCHVGDSRAYLFRDGILRQITEDHTLVGRLLADGLITAEAAARHPQKNVIVQALGSGREPSPDTFHVNLENGDVILLCSDGLHGLVSGEDIASRLSSLPTRDAGESLMERAKEMGGADNITIIILKLAGKNPSADQERKPFSQSASGERDRMRNALIGAILVALVCGGFFFLWTRHEFGEKKPPNLGDVIRVSK